MFIIKNFIIFLVLLFTFNSCNDSFQTRRIYLNNWEYAIDNNVDIYSIDNLNFKPVGTNINSLHKLLTNEVGFIWLKTKFLVLDEFNTNRPIGVFLGRITFADETYFNRKFIGSMGKFPPNFFSEWNSFRNYTVDSSIVNFDKDNEILIKIFVYGEGSITGTPFISDYQTTKFFTDNLEFNNSIINAFISVVLTAFALYHLLIFSKRPQDKENLYFSLLSLFFSLYLTNFFITKIPGFYKLNIKYLPYQKLIFSLQYLMGFAGVKFFTSFLKCKTNKIANIFLLAITLGSIIAIIIPSNYPDMRQITRIISPILVVYLLFMIYYLIKAIIQRKKEALTLLIGFSPFLIFTVLDIILHQILRFNELIYFAGLGFPAFLIAIVFILANMFVNFRNEAEELNIHLEQKVMERTAEVNALIEQQLGDYYLTSLLINPLNVNNFKDENLFIDFIISQKKKFKFKKWNSEIGGDVCLAFQLNFQGDKYAFFINGDAMGKSIQGAGGALIFDVIIHSMISKVNSNTSPEEFLRDVYYNLENIFEQFDGSMMMSCVIGLINVRTGKMLFINCEHPWNVVYRNGKAKFIDDINKIGKKIGTIGFASYYIQSFYLEKGDMIFLGSDGRDDILIETQNGQKVINEDENQFLYRIEECNGDLEKIYERIQSYGKLTDDISIMRIHYIGIPERSEQSVEEIKIKASDLYKKGLYQQSLDLLLTIKDKLINKEEIFKINILIAHCYAKLKNYKLSLEFFNKSLEIKPNDANILKNIEIIKQYL